MAKFFRKFRFNFISQKRVGNYLLYAAGEIILVVIGILIALSINNANQRRIIAEKERAYLKGLHSEFLTSRRKLQELIRVNANNMEGARQLMEYIDSEDLPDEKEFSSRLFETFANDISYNPNTSILIEMISSGSLKDLSNDSLRTRLTTWLATMEDITKQEDDLRLQRENVLDMFRTESYSLRTVTDQAGITENALGIAPGESKTSNLKLLDSKQFENNLLMFMLTTRQTETAHYLPLMNELDEILSSIKTQIDQKP